MPHHLYVTASVRTEGSKSGELGRFFREVLCEIDPNATFSERDVGITPPPHPTEAYTVANYTPPHERTDDMNETLKSSDELIDEMLASDTLIFAVPMYNFSVPSTFKAYIDNLVRVGRTFFPTKDGGFSGALGDKKALFITTRGATYGNDSPIKDFDLQTPWMRTVYGFMGLTDMTFVHADGLDFGGPDYRNESLAAAKAQLTEIAKTW